MRLKSLTPRDRDIFDRYLSLCTHGLSVYTFENIYIWKSLYSVQWAIIGDCLCVFLRDSMGCFLYLPPIGRKVTADTVRTAFMVMDRLNKNTDISRIENIGETDVSFYESLGYIVTCKSHEYICSQPHLAGLSGNAFKSQRASRNYFLKHYDGRYILYTSRHAGACRALYARWAAQRCQSVSDAMYRGMLQDSKKVLAWMLAHYRQMRLEGRLVYIGSTLAAFTFGFALSRETFCVLYEITDLSIKGLAQYIFWSFAREMNAYRYINIMDDSGLANLKTTKMRYHPVRLIPAYIAKRPHAQTY